MMWTDDPVRDEMRYHSRIEDEDSRKKHCDHCGILIGSGEEYYLINKEILCPECVKEEYRLWEDEW